MFYRAVIIGVLIVAFFVVAECLCDCIDYDDPNTLDNGLFECGDPDLTIYDFTPPTCWERFPHPDSRVYQVSLPEKIDCYAALHYDFAFSSGGSNWEISHPFEGDTFVLLSTGGLGAEPNTIADSAIKGSIISQEVFLSPGDTIIGAYFFGTSDYRPYNDYGEIFLEQVDPNNYPNSPDSFTIPQSRCDVTTVNNYRSTFEISPETNGWISFSHIVEPNQVGAYYLQCQVTDYGDTIYPSYYAVDNLRICKGGLSDADLNYDCNVNLEDYSIISKAWLAFCPDIPFDDPNFPGDPNDYPLPVTDPNIPCQLADIDNSWYVDPNDLIIMTEDWLY